MGAVYGSATGYDTNAAKLAAGAGGGGAGAEPGPLALVEMAINTLKLAAVRLRQQGIK